ncbi:MAG: hypothetical protein QNJ18_07675 [Xenococcaceae cyanobacterium MO_167.B52]|nr:hypothetical protein [Xenococcaceae cyanobacterium MO_167.B52]
MNDKIINSELDAIQEPITNAPPEVKQIIAQVLNLEKAKLYLKSPRNINEEILQIIKNVIQ